MINTDKTNMYHLLKEVWRIVYEAVSLYKYEPADRSTMKGIKNLIDIELTKLQGNTPLMLDDFKTGLPLCKDGGALTMEIWVTPPISVEHIPMTITITTERELADGEENT